MALLLLSTLYVTAADTLYTEHSPDGKMIFSVKLLPDGQWQYRIDKKGQTLLHWSPLGFTAADGRTFPAPGTVFSKADRSVVDETSPWLFGENKTIKNQYRQLLIHCKQPDGLGYDLQVRVFNTDIAFRYLFPENTSTQLQKLVAEQTGFVFPHSYTLYQHNIESVFTAVDMNRLLKSSDLPVVLSSPEALVSINEAQNENYTKATVGRGEATNSLSVQFGKDTVQLRGNFQTPWRTLSFDSSAAALANHSDLLYKLNPPAPVSQQTDWIRPGKLLRDMTLTTAGAKDCIDFAARMHFQYVMFDAGWYGKGYAAEFDKESDPHRVVANINMPEVIREGKEKGIGIILYVNYVGLRKHNLDTLFGLYKNWGVKGLKFGFVNGLTQSGISWLMQAVRKAQDYGFIINVHDNYKPTGISRTIPAWLTQEGVRGNENNPDAFHNTTLPFTRFLSGPADYTFCYRSQNDSFNHTILDKKLQVSKAHQLALTVLFYSPLQSMLWYGRPAYYQKPEEIEFFQQVPTTWDKTIHISGEIGKYATVARMQNGEWYIGSAAAEAHNENITLEFLDKAKKYSAIIYTDDGQGGILKKVMNVNTATVLPLHVNAKEGVAVRIIAR